MMYRYPWAMVVKEVKFFFNSYGTGISPANLRSARSIMDILNNEIAGLSLPGQKKVNHAIFVRGKKLKYLN